MKELELNVGDYVLGGIDGYVYLIDSMFNHTSFLVRNFDRKRIEVDSLLMPIRFKKCYKNGTLINDNEETKIMKHQKFKVGDFIIHNIDCFVYFIDDICDQAYYIRRNSDGKSYTVDLDEILRNFKKCNENGSLIYNNYIETKIMENTKQQLQKIQINSAVDAILVSPKMHGTMALVDLMTLKRITSYMRSDSFESIIDYFISGLKNAQSIEQYIGMMKEEILFHESVNLISEIEIENNQEEIKTSIH